MNIYYVSRLDPVAYDEYDSFVVICKDEETALNWHPYNGKGQAFIKHPGRDTWTLKSNIKVEYVGESTSNEEEIVCASYQGG